MTSKPKIAILTFCVGADYKKAMEPGLASKREYAKRHGYDFHEGGDDVWDRTKPIPWSKFNFILKYINDYDFLFWSDADVIILNQELMLETQVLHLLPTEKDLLWTLDACHHFNNGHLLIRGKSAWAADYFRRASQQADLLYHIWWDNAAMIRLYETNATDKAMIETCREHWKFNSYIYGPTDKADDPTTRLYKPGDFLIHFAGVYDPWNIHRLMLYTKHQHDQGRPLNTILLDSWRKDNVKDKSAATTSIGIIAMIEHLMP